MTKKKRPDASGIPISISRVTQSSFKIALTTVLLSATFLNFPSLKSSTVSAMGQAPTNSLRAVVDSNSLPELFQLDGWYEWQNIQNSDGSWNGFKRLPRSANRLAGNSNAIIDGGNKPEVFARDVNGNITRIYENSDNSWHSSWETLSSSGDFTSDPYVIGVPSGGSTYLHVFATKSNGLVYENVAQSNGTWSGFTQLASNTPTFAGNPIVVLDGSSLLEAFTKDASGNVYQLTQSSSGTWNTSWTNLTSGFSTTTLVNDLSVQMYPTGSNLLMLFARGNDGKIYEDVQSNSTTWGGFSAVTSNSTSFTGSPYTIMDSGNKPEIFAKDSNGDYFQLFQDSVNTWHSSWTSLTASFSPKFASNPVVTFPTYGGVGNVPSVFGRGNDAYAYEDKYQSSSWGGFTLVGRTPTYQNSVAGTNPSAYIDNQELLNSFELKSGSLYQNTKQSSGTWSGFSSLPFGGTTYTGKPVFIMDALGHPQVFVRDTSNNLWNSYFDFSTNTWSTSRSQLASNLAGDPSVALLPNGQFIVTAVDTSGYVVYSFQNSSGGYPSFTRLTSSNSFTGNTFVVVDGTGNPEIFARDTSSNIYQMYEDSSTTWHSSWINLTSGFTTTTLVSDPVVITDPLNAVGAAGLQNVFARGNDGKVYQSIQASNGSFGSFTAVTSNSTSFTGDIAVFVDDVDLAEIFARGTDGHIYQLYKDSSTTWHSSWVDLNSGFSATTFTGDPSIVDDGSNRGFVMALGANGNNYVDTYSNPGSGYSWGGFTSIGN